MSSKRERGSRRTSSPVPPSPSASPYSTYEDQGTVPSFSRSPRPKSYQPSKPETSYTADPLPVPNRQRRSSLRNGGIIPSSNTTRNVVHEKGRERESSRAPSAFENTGVERRINEADSIPSTPPLPSTTFSPSSAARVTSISTSRRHHDSPRAYTQSPNIAPVTKRVVEPHRTIHRSLIQHESPVYLGSARTQTTPSSRSKLPARPTSPSRQRSRSKGRTPRPPVPLSSDSELEVSMSGPPVPPSRLGSIPRTSTPGVGPRDVAEEQGPYALPHLVSEWPSPGSPRRFRSKSRPLASNSEQTRLVHPTQIMETARYGESRVSTSARDDKNNSGLSSGWEQLGSPVVPNGDHRPLKTDDRPVSRQERAQQDTHTLTVIPSTSKSYRWEKSRPRQALSPPSTPPTPLPESSTSPVSRRKRAPTLTEERPVPPAFSPSHNSLMETFSPTPPLQVRAQPPLEGPGRAGQEANSNSVQTWQTEINSLNQREIATPTHSSLYSPVPNPENAAVLAPLITAQADPLPLYINAQSPGKRAESHRKKPKTRLQTETPNPIYGSMASGDLPGANAITGLVNGLGLELGLSKSKSERTYSTRESRYREATEPGYTTPSHVAKDQNQVIGNPAKSSSGQLRQSTRGRDAHSRMIEDESFGIREPTPRAPPPTAPSISSGTSWSKTRSEGTGTSRSLSEGTGASGPPELGADESDLVPSFQRQRRHSQSPELEEDVLVPETSASNGLPFSLTPAESLHRISASPHIGADHMQSEAPNRINTGREALFLALEQPCEGLGHSLGNTAEHRDSGLWDSEHGGVWHPQDEQPAGVEGVPNLDNVPLRSHEVDVPDRYEHPSRRRDDTGHFQDFVFPRLRTTLPPTNSTNPQTSLSPKIVIQPSTSSSSDGGSIHHREVSQDSTSTYSDTPAELDASRELSKAAEQLFRTLKDGDLSPHGDTQANASDQTPDPVGAFRSKPDITHSPHSFASESNIPKTWKSTLPAPAFQSLVERYGAFEMQRQEVIWELCTTEQHFVQSLRIVLRLFVQPLRTTNQSRWIPGISKDITNLFDWLDDILQLHSHISSALLDVRNTQYPIVTHLAESLRPFVSRLEVHQPYIVRLDTVSHMIGEMVRDPHSDFGEFIRMQSSSPECGQMNLNSFLLKPVQRLMKYPLFFKQLWELTPRNHPDYLATFSLFHTTDLIIRVMNEVKAREDEHELVKSLAERIKGLPNGFQLARRERRLIAQGLLRRIIPNEKDAFIHEDQVVQTSSNSPRVASLKSPPLVAMSVSSPGQTSSPALPSHLSKLMPITSPHFNRASFEFDHHSPNESLTQTRPDSTASDASQVSGSSGTIYDNHTTDETRSTTSSVFLMSPSGTEYSLRPDSMTSSLAGFDSNEGYTRFVNRNPSLRGCLRKRESQVYAFVFTDFLLLTTPMSDRHLLRSPRVGEKKECWKVLEDVGMSRILGVSDQSGRLAQEHLISLEVLPMSPELRENEHTEILGAISVHLSLPERMTSRMALAPKHVLEEARSKWYDSFQQCFCHTLRALSLPNTGYRLLPNGALFDPYTDSRRTVISILASGLPLPKSPSQQAMDELDRGDSSERITQEREERGWWSLQFCQMLQQMERSDARLAQINMAGSVFSRNTSLVARPRLARSNELKRTSMNGGPRPLLLVSQSHSTSPAISSPVEEKRGLLRSFSKKGRS